MKVQIHEILNIYFDRKKIVNPSYSLRALARDLKCSAPYLSTIFSGKKPFPMTRLSDFIKVLDLDDIAILQIKDSIESPVDRKNDIHQSDLDFFSKYKPLGQDKFSVLKNWYNVAILDLTTCKGFQSNSEWISKKLKISKLETEIAIESLMQHDLLELKDGVYKKKDLKIRFPTNTSKDVIRNFHKQIIQKAMSELDRNTSSEAFEKRLITGTTFALNEEKLAELKEKIQHTLYDIATSAPEGECSEVYQFNVQLFPLTTQTK